MDYFKYKVYVACSLTHAPQEFKDCVEELKNELKKICQVLLFKGISDANLPHDVYVHDIIDCVYECDLLVAICDYPAIGLGWEMGTQAEERKKPILAVAHKDAKVSKLVLDPQLVGYEFRRYENLCEDVSKMVIEKLKVYSSP